MTLVLVYTLSKTILGHSFFNYILVVIAVVCGITVRDLSTLIAALANYQASRGTIVLMRLCIPGTWVQFL